MQQRFGLKMATNYTVTCVGHYHPNGEQCEFHGKCGVFPHEQVVKWTDKFTNRVVTVGLNALLDNTFNAAAGAVDWFVGLIGAGDGTVSITSGAAAVTGSGTSFTSADNGSDIVIVGAGAAGADLVSTVSGNPSSGTALNTADNAGTTVAGVAYALEPRAAETMGALEINEVTPYSDAARPDWTKNGAASSGAMSNSSSKAVFNINATSRVFGAFLSNDDTKGGTSGVLYGGGLFTAGSRAVQSGDTLNVQADLSATAA